MRFFVMAGLLAAFSAGSAAAQSAQQFDLTCVGERSESLDGPAEPYEYAFRVDLTAKRWCWRDCATTFAIEEVAPDRITFSNDRTDTRFERRSSRNSVSRATGEHELLAISVLPVPRYYRVTGRCTPAPFSGFPATLF